MSILLIPIWLSLLSYAGTFPGLVLLRVLDDGILI